MEYQKIVNLIDDIANQHSKFKTNNWVEINDESINQSIKHTMLIARLNVKLKC